MAEDLKGKRVAFLFTEGVEQVELIEPLDAVRDAGAEADTVSLKAGKVQMFNHLDKGDEIDAETGVSDVDASGYDALVLPGGVANPDQLRTDEDAVRFVKEFAEQHKPIGVICHGPWTMVEADVVRGRSLTSWPSLQTDLRNAGATWGDEPVHVCSSGPNILITSRRPGDLKDFDDAFVTEFIKAAKGARWRMGAPH